MKRRENSVTSRAAFLIGLLYFIAGWHGNNVVRAQSLSDSNLPVEKFILEKIAAGEIADLAQQFPGQADRVVRAAFLENLITDALEDVTIHRRGVRIKSAILTEPLNGVTGGTVR